ncbi:MAG: hypothetical protein AAFV69_07625 [Pseudomonadota bacterium]
MHHSGFERVLIGMKSGQGRHQQAQSFNSQPNLRQGTFLTTESGAGSNTQTLQQATAEQYYRDQQQARAAVDFAEQLEREFQKVVRLVEQPNFLRSQEFQTIRRDYARRFHPDVAPNDHNQLATKRMAQLNGLLDGDPNERAGT